jgi:hypothetical protein
MVAATEHLKELGISITEMLENHFALFKLELREDVKVAGQQLGAIVALLPLLLLGWAFLCVALGILLGRVMPLDLSFLLVGVLNLAIAASGVGLAFTKLVHHRWLPRSQREAEASVDAVTHLGPHGARHA